MNKTDIAKRVVSTIVGIGTTKIVSSIISTTTDPESVTDKVAVLASSFVIGSMAVEATRNWTDTKIDGIVIWYHELASKK